jgi:hypothetical protein
MPRVTAPKNEKRQHPRYELYATVELHDGGETLVLPARNLSLGGVSLASDGHDLSGFTAGQTLDVLVFDAIDVEAAPVRAPAKVIRRDRDTLALMWTLTDPQQSEKLAHLLESLKPKKHKQTK